MVDVVIKRSLTFYRLFNFPLSSSRQNFYDNHPFTRLQSVSKLNPTFDELHAAHQKLDLVLMGVEWTSHKF